jgi:hypothetical protein
MKRLELICLLSHTLNVLSKGLFNMDAIAWLTAIWVACWVAAYAPDFNKEQSQQPEKTNGTTTSPQK